MASPLAFRGSLLLLVASLTTAVQAQDADAGALDLVSAPATPTETTASPLKLFVEGAAGVGDQRYGGGSQSLGRASADLFYAGRLGTAWRAVVSDRLDAVHPRQYGADGTVNSLRELFAGWDAADGATTLDLGRINWRQGPAYGFNPTDFFRDGSLRVVTTADPLAQRQNRLGVAMLRGQQSWQGGSVALGLAPKLADRPSAEGWSADLGSTNSRERALAVANQQFSQRVNAQFLLYKERGLDAQVGASINALVSDAVVAFGEWSHAREPSLLSRTVGGAQQNISGQRAAAGLTYTTTGRLSVTAEAHYNSFAIGQSEWDRATAGGSGLPLLGAYLLEAQRRQDLASRRAYMLYVSQPSAGIKALDLAAFVRVDGDDHSSLTWVEARYHWNAFDAALQWQHFGGRSFSRYGLNPYRQTLQAIVSFHFR